MLICNKAAFSWFSHGCFSNSSLTLISTQTKNAELEDYFDDIISVEKTGSFKPDPNVYKFAAEKLGESVSALRLVATHSDLTEVPKVQLKT
jgi:HAD superfamily hydrolase (TIGR01493 family)